MILKTTTKYIRSLDKLQQYGNQVLDSKYQVVCCKSVFGYTSVTIDRVEQNDNQIVALFITMSHCRNITLTTPFGICE